MFLTIQQSRGTTGYTGGRDKVFVGRIFHQTKEGINSGDKIETGQLLGTVKCMNLMFEIDSPVDGILIDVMVREDEIVEYGQLLFRISKF